MRADERHKFARGLGNRTICKKMRPTGIATRTKQKASNKMSSNARTCQRTLASIVREAKLCVEVLLNSGKKKEMKGQGVTGVS